MYDPIRRENPGLSLTELTKIMSTMWSNLPPETKARYERKYQETKEYERKMRQHEASQRAGEINSLNNPRSDALRIFNFEGSFFPLKFVKEFGLLLYHWLVNLRKQI